MDTLWSKSSGIAETEVEKMMMYTDTCQIQEGGEKMLWLGDFFLTAHNGE